MDGWMDAEFVWTGLLAHPFIHLSVARTLTNIDAQGKERRAD